MRDIRVATVQFQHAPGDKSYNFDRVRYFVTEAARERVEIVAFPEMCLTGYWHVRKLSREAFEALAEPVPAGPSTEELLRLSRENRMTIGAGLLERRDELMAALKSDRDKGGHVLSALMVTDIVAGGTELLVAGDAAPLERAFGEDLTDGAMTLPGVMSRKKQVAPELLAAV